MSEKLETLKTLDRLEALLGEKVGSKEEFVSWFSLIQNEAETFLQVPARELKSLSAKDIDRAIEMNESLRRLYDFISEVQEGSEMVTIAKLAQETGVNERTTRNRITKAIDRGVLTAWEKQGGTILIQRQAGLEIVRAVGQVIKKE